ncbi:MAG TPA: glycosyltransferase [Thermoanaerobaculia bacterium]|jgi:glycosyltransferase involved in cell wall biosynthesis|nr:glycosyltransferase [Thermoanaerobaculia bacterium]
MKLSVVLAVFNGASTLAATLNSILGQTERDFELIVVDDGSTDATPALLGEYAMRDMRVRVITQANAGLTRALIRGCAEARADVIARHDNGDRSHPERFARQLAMIANGAMVVSCATRFVDADGDLLYISRGDGDEVRQSLLRDDGSRIHALPHHGSAMFRRDAYQRAGGYRAEFRVAQDLDLWIRIARDGGTFAIIEDVLYDATVDARSISGTARAAQVRLTEIAVALRDGGGSLAEAARVAPAPMTRRGEAAALYFIGKCLLQQGNRKGSRVLRDAIRRDPLHWRAWLSLFGVR